MYGIKGNFTIPSFSLDSSLTIELCSFRLSILCFHCRAIKNKNRNPLKKVKNLGKKINIQNTSPKIRTVRYFICERYSERCFAQIYKALYGDAMLVSL